MTATTPLPTPPSLTTDVSRAAALKESYRDVSRHICQYLVELREFDLHRSYRPPTKGGTKAADTPEWLRLACGAEKATTAEHLRVAYSLLNTPEIEAAFGNGELSYGKVRALAHVVDTATESSMLNCARSMTDAQVEELCRRTRRPGYTGLGQSQGRQQGQQGPQKEPQQAWMADVDRVVVYHNPACSKCRGALAILNELDVAFHTVEYLREPLDMSGLRHILGLLDSPPADLVRKDGHFQELGLLAANYTTVDAVAALLAEHPRLMQRPVVVRGNRALIARPSELVKSLF